MSSTITDVPAIENLTEKILYTKKEIEKKTRHEAKKIVNYCLEKNIKEILLVIIFEGAMFIAIDLVNYMTEYLIHTNQLDKLRIITDSIIISSYGEEQETNRQPRLIKDMKEKSKGKHILLVEDIIDSGYTIDFYLGILNQERRKPASITIFSMIDKIANREIHRIDSDFLCFTLKDDEFVVGKGLDFKHNYRHLPYIITIKDKYKLLAD